MYVYISTHVQVLVNAIFSKHGSIIMDKYPFDLVEGNTDGRNVLNVLATDLVCFYIYVYVYAIVICLCILLISIHVYMFVIQVYSFI